MSKKIKKAIRDAVRLGLIGPGPIKRFVDRSFEKPISPSVIECEICRARGR